MLRRTSNRSCVTSESRSSSPIDPISRCGSGQLDVGLAAHKAEVRRPAQNEWWRDGGGTKAHRHRPVSGAVAELVPGPARTAGGIEYGGQHLTLRVDQHQILRCGMRGVARVPERDLHRDEVWLDIEIGNPERVSPQVGTRSGRAAAGGGEWAGDGWGLVWHLQRPVCEHRNG